MKMAAVTFFTAIALLCYASAQNSSTTLLLPDGLFWVTPPSPQTFLGAMTVTDKTTYYTIDCGNFNDTLFWPGSSGCANNNSYTFSADAANTQYLMPK